MHTFLFFIKYCQSPHLFYVGAYRKGCGIDVVSWNVALSTPSDAFFDASLFCCMSLNFENDDDLLWVLSLQVLYWPWHSLSTFLMKSCSLLLLSGTFFKIILFATGCFVPIFVVNCAVHLTQEWSCYLVNNNFCSVYCKRHYYFVHTLGQLFQMSTYMRRSLSFFHL